MAFREERKSSLKPILFLAVWGVLVLAGVKAFPVYSGSSKLADYLRDLAVHASMQKTAANEVKAEIVRYARNLGLPIVDNEVRVTRTEDTLQIKLDYTVPVKLGVFTWNLRFTPSVESRAYN
jgi:hypothetical protein